MVLSRIANLVMLTQESRLQATRLNYSIIFILTLSISSCPIRISFTPQKVLDHLHQKLYTRLIMRWQMSSASTGGENLVLEERLCSL